MCERCCEGGFLLTVSCSLAGGSLPPLPPDSMTRVWDFVADLARAGKGYLEIIKNGGNGLWGQGPEEDGYLCHLEKSPKKMVRTASLIVSFAAAVEADRRQCIKSLAAIHGVSVYTIHSILHKDLDSKRSPPDGSEAFEHGTERRASLDLQLLHRRHPALVHGDGG